MTWRSPRERHAARVVLAAILCAFLLVSACANPLAHSGAKKADGPPRCADLIAHAMTVQAPQPVAGAYACLAPDIQAQANAVQIRDDASFAEYASGEPVYTAYRYIGHTPPAVPKPAKVYYYFELTPLQCYRVSVDANGLVDGGSFGPVGLACPK